MEQCSPMTSQPFLIIGGVRRLNHNYQKLFGPAVVFLNAIMIIIVARGCQMVYFQTKNPYLGKFWRAL
jgi:hypothetical protein